MKNKSTEVLITEYISLVKFHSNSDTFDKSNIRAINKAANRLIKIAEQINLRDDKFKFYELLDNENSSIRSWAAFNSIERMDSSNEIIDKAISVIKELANSDNVDAFGAQMWLRNWKTNGS